MGGAVTTTVTTVESLPPGERPPVASPQSLAGVDAILLAIADVKGEVGRLASALESHKHETAAQFLGIADTVEQIVSYVNGASFPPPGAPPSDGSAPASVEPLRITVPRAAQVAADAKKGVELLTEQMVAVQSELRAQSSLMGMGKKGLAWAVSAEGRKQLGLLALAIVGVMHTLGWVK